MGARYIVGDVFDVLATLEPGSVDLVMTSPPFLALRSYLPDDHEHKGKEIGSEATPGAFIDTMLDVVEACARVLAPHGSLIFEMGDTYAGSGSPGGDYNEGGMRAGQPRTTYSSARAAERKPRSCSAVATEDAAPPSRLRTRRQLTGWPLDKSKVLIPQLFAVSLAYGRNVLRAPLSGRELIDVAERWALDLPPEFTARDLLTMMSDFLDKYEQVGHGAHEIEPWRVRNTVAWCRPNPAVGRDGDKFRAATSFLTVACKASDRYWDGDAVRKTQSEPDRVFASKIDVEHNPTHGAPSDRPFEQNAAGAPLLDWWEIPTSPYKGAHYATYPKALVLPIVKSMAPRRVCRVCGEPSRRITAQGAPDPNRPQSKRAMELADAAGLTPEHLAAVYACGIGDVGKAVVTMNGVGHNAPDVQRLADEAKAVLGGYYREFTMARPETVGWSDCAHDDYRPGVVLDPFAGSGTTLLVATGHGLDAIGIDLDERNAVLAEQRIGGMFLTVEHT